eukprot:4478646-Alexandrium_andersonii.AAC.1
MHLCTGMPSCTCISRQAHLRTYAFPRPHSHEPEPTHARLQASHISATASLNPHATASMSAILDA